MPWASRIAGDRRRRPDLGGLQCLGYRLAERESVFSACSSRSAWPCCWARSFAATCARCACSSSWANWSGPGSLVWVFTFPLCATARRFGGWVLLGGLAATAIAGTGVWFFVLPYLALSTAIFVQIATGTLTIIAVVAVVWLFVDMFVAPGYFCHNLCPTGIFARAGWAGFTLASAQARRRCLSRQVQPVRTSLSIRPVSPRKDPPAGL